MRRFKTGLAAVMAAGWMAAAPGPAAAQTIKPEEIVQTRKATMDMVAAIVDLIKEGQATGMDPKRVAEAAEALVVAGKSYQHLFPDGTQSVGDTKAKAEIWSDRAGFEKANAAFVTASTNLATAARGGDKAAIAAALTAEGQSCGGCHRAYKNR